MHRSNELQALISTYFQSLGDGNPDFVERHVLRGPELRLIGTDPDEWYQGVDGFDLLRREAANGYGGLRAVADDIEAYSSGDVGWGAARIRFTDGDGRSARARETVVFHRFEGIWKLVSSHTSIAVADEDAFVSEHDESG